MENLIQNAFTLFDERTPPTVLSPYGSLLGLEFSRSAEVGSTAPHRPCLVVGGVPTSTQSFFSTSYSDSLVEGRHTPLLGLSLSQTLKEGAEMTTQEHVIPRTGGTQVVEALLNSSPPEAVSLPPTPATEWWLPHLGLHQHPETLTIPQSRPESVLSNTSDFSFSAASWTSGTTEFPLSPATSFLSSTTEFPPSPAASFLSSIWDSSSSTNEGF
ncbi:hypothetical protein EDB83DRAFT_2409057 [Lactarius deliciosus]|nr:hypothetical protein EDB83DRAFT_2409057 [Lactarius deliciosus]